MSRGDLPLSNPPIPASPEPHRHARVTPLASRGESWVWITGAALAACVLLIVTLISLTLVNGFSTFWPRPIERLTFAGGEVVMGVPIRTESFDPRGEELEAFRAAVAQGGLLPDAVDDDGRPTRRLYRIGNREVYGQPFRWIPLFTVAEIERPQNAFLLERLQWGVWVGMPEAVLVDGERVAEGPEASWEAFQRLHDEARARFEEAQSLRTHEVGKINAALEKQRLKLRAAEIEHQRTEDLEAGRIQRGMGFLGWGLLLLGTIGALVAAVRFTSWDFSGRSRARPPALAILSAVLWCTAAGLGLASWLESPFSRPNMSDERLAQVKMAHDAAVEALEARYAEVQNEILEIENEDARYRALWVEASTGRFAPVRQTEPDAPMLISQVVRAVPGNDLTFAGKVQVYLSRWWEYLSDGPREANSEGGVFPVISGTVLLTVLLSVVVVPLGVVAAIYLREYARQGLIISIVRIAVNNLAGVPSIVFGVFGLGFFCYIVGSYIDTGPAQPAGRGGWWIGLAAVLWVTLGAITLGVLSKPVPGQHPSRTQKLMVAVGGLTWFGAVIGAAALIAKTPYFHGFFEAAQPSPVFGSRGLLWSSVTLALLTLPVVIVATEEAIAAVPNSMREGAYGCGASKWQTIRTIVLPRALPGIMTGMILAMARGAGEVAPLMLTGAVKLAPELPVSGDFPFVHLNRSFMHLGFHIYDVGFQSPDSEAARPMVWTTTLLLVAVVLLMNITAIRVRTRLRKKFIGGAF